MAHSRVAVAIAIAFAVTALNTYSFFAWLPEIMKDHAGVPPAEAGAMLAVYALVGLPLALVMPLLAARVRNVGILIGIGVGCFVGGYTGLLVIPTVAPWVWVILTGLGGSIFPLCLALIGLRTRSPEAAVALSGFAQATGYACGALGPLLIALIHDVTGQWTAPLAVLIATSLVALVPAVALARRRDVEDDLADRAGN
jgi:CP family cyanate transporter-like MFS transporter